MTAGFIDLHSHAYDIGGARLQAMDGVTTALELEAGVAPVRIAYERAAAAGRPVNYGFATSWALARMEVLDGVRLDGELRTLFANVASPGWQRAATGARDSPCPGPAGGRHRRRRARHRRAGRLRAAARPDEYLAVAALAANASVPTFTHSRDLIEFAPDTLIDGAEEIVRAAGETGAHMHYCHVNSTTMRQADRVLGLVERARAGGRASQHRGVPVRRGHDGDRRRVPRPGTAQRTRPRADALTYAPTGERIATADRLRELRAADPGGLGSSASRRG